MSLNSFLLSKIVKKSGLGFGAQSLLRRYQALSIIYINFFFIALFLWIFIDLYLHPLPHKILLLFITPSTFISLILLRQGKHDISAILLLSILHLDMFIISSYCHISLAAICVITVYPSISFFLTSSKRIHFLNMGLCVIQNLWHIAKIHEIFKVTFTDEQEAQILYLKLISLFGIGFMWMLFHLQKSIETKLWQVAQSNYEKAENITKEVVQAVESKDTFVSSLSHEIRNPLNALKGSIDYLLKVVKDASHLQVLNNAKLSGEILLNLVNNVLDAAKLKSDKMELSFIETSSIDIVRKVLLIHSESLEEKKIFAQAFIDKSLPSVLWTDPSRLLQITINLFSNALKFTAKKGKIRLIISWCNNEETREDLLTPSEEFTFYNYFEEDERTLPHLIMTQKTSVPPESTDSLEDSFNFEEFNFETSKNHLNNLQNLKPFMSKALKELNTNEAKTAQTYSVWNISKVLSSNIQQTIHNYPSVVRTGREIKEKGFLKVEISDTGCGISEEDIPKLFQMFVQADRNIPGIHGGSGLGLWICKQLCQKMGGDIAIYSKPGKGTTFVFYIPVNNDLLSEVCYTKNAPPVHKKIRALVVDDQAYNRDLHKLILEREGVQVTLANDGKQAYEKFMKQDEGYFDFIMMDVQMPEMDGFTSARSIRKWENEKKRKKVDIYFVSGEYYNEEEVMAGLVMSGGAGDKENAGIRCLRKPIDVEMTRKVIQKYTKKTSQLSGCSSKTNLPVFPKKKK